MNRDFPFPFHAKTFHHLMQAKLIDKTVIKMVDFLLEPNETTRPDMQAVCAHPYFPTVLQEDEHEIRKALQLKQRPQDVAREEDATKSDSG